MNEPLELKGKGLTQCHNGTKGKLKTVDFHERDACISGRGGQIPPVYAFYSSRSTFITMC